MKKIENTQRKKFTKILAMVCAILLMCIILFAILLNAFSPLVYAEDEFFDQLWYIDDVVGGSTVEGGSVAYNVTGSLGFTYLFDTITLFKSK